MTTTIITNNSTGGDFTGTEDLRIAGGDPTGNYGTDVAVDLDSGSDVLLKFTGLSNIVGPVTVSAVTLSIFHTNSPGADTWTLYRILQQWTEAGCTWNTKDGAAAWNTAGCNGSGTDRAASNSFSASAAAGAGYADITGSAGMIADVQGWINGSFTNAGWKISVPTLAYVISTKNGTDAQRPKLTVVYTAGGGGGGQVSSRNGIALSGISAINGITKSGISRINGLTI